MTKLVPLTRGLYALVDDDDWARVSVHKWYATNDGYAARDIWKSRKERGKEWMHRVVLPHAGRYTDHLNGDRLDNRKLNLRVATASQNSRNRHTDGPYRNVHWQKANGRWRVGLKVNGRMVHFGYFDDREEARAVAEQARRDIYASDA